MNFCNSTIVVLATHWSSFQLILSRMFMWLLWFLFPTPKLWAVEHAIPTPRALSRARKWKCQSGKARRAATRRSDVCVRKWNCQSSCCRRQFLSSQCRSGRLLCVRSKIRRVACVPMSDFDSWRTVGVISCSQLQ